MKKQLMIILLSLCGAMMWAQDVADTLRIGLLLPLQADVLKRDRNMDRFADFYTGALLAVYEVQEKGQPIEMYTYDVGKTGRGVQQVLESGKLDSLDMIIGPAYPQQVGLVSSWAKTCGVKTLLPFSSEVQGIAHNPYLLQFNASESLEAEAMANYLGSQDRTVRCIFVENDGVDVPRSVSLLQRALRNEGLECVWTTLGEIMHDSLSMVLEDDVENVLLLNTERYANLRMLMPYLNRAAQGKQLTLLSRYSWQGEKIILPQLYCTIFKQPNENELAQYETLYHRFIAKERVASRPCYDLLGYDLMGCVLRMLMLGTQNDMGQEMEYDGLQSDIEFEQLTENGGYYNIHVDVIRTE